MGIGVTLHIGGIGLRTIRYNCLKTVASCKYIDMYDNHSYCRLNPQFM